MSTSVGPINKRYVCYVGVGLLPKAKAEKFFEDTKAAIKEQINLNPDESMWFIVTRHDGTMIEVLP